MCDLESLRGGVESDIQGADREVQTPSPAKERDGDPNEPKAPQHPPSLRLVRRR